MRETSACDMEDRCDQQSVTGGVLSVRLGFSLESPVDLAVYLILPGDLEQAEGRSPEYIMALPVGKKCCCYTPCKITGGTQTAGHKHKGKNGVNQTGRQVPRLKPCPNPYTLSWHNILTVTLKLS